MNFKKVYIFLFLLIVLSLTSCLFPSTDTSGVYPFYSSHYKNGFIARGDYQTFADGTEANKSSLISQIQTIDDGFFAYWTWGGTLTSASISQNDINAGYSDCLGLYGNNGGYFFLYCNGAANIANNYEYNNLPIKNDYINFSSPQNLIKLYSERLKDLSNYKYMMFDINLKNCTDSTHSVIFDVKVSSGGDTLYEAKPVLYEGSSDTYIGPQVTNTSSDHWYNIVLSTAQINTILTDNNKGKGVNPSMSHVDLVGFIVNSNLTTFYIDNFVFLKNMPNYISISTTNIIIPQSTTLFLSADAYDSSTNFTAISPPKWTGTGILSPTKKCYTNSFSNSTAGNYTIAASQNIYNPDNQTSQTVSGNSYLTVSNSIPWQSSFVVYNDTVNYGILNSYTSNATLSYSVDSNHEEGNNSYKVGYTINSGGWAGIYIENTVKDMTFCSSIPDMLSFWIKLSYPRDLMIGIRSNNINSNNNNAKINLSELSGINLNSTDWQEVRIILDNFKQREPKLDFSNIVDYLIITDTNPGQGEFYIDNIQWKSTQLSPYNKPAISHTPLQTIVGINKTVRINTTVIDNNAQPNVTLFYAINNTSTWITVPMTVVSSGVGSYSAYCDVNINTTGNLYYCIKAEDSLYKNVYWNDKTTTTPQIIPIALTSTSKIGVSGGILDLGDGASKMVIPVAALTQDQNIVITPLSIDDSTMKALNGQRPILAYNCTPEGLHFNTVITMTLSYQNISLASGTNEKNIKAYYWNDIAQQWVLIGGIVNTLDKTITFETNHFSLYAIFITPFSKDFYKPKYRIITPNGDGYNDTIQFNNLDDVNTQIAIYDINGRKVRDIKQPPYVWDGKDNWGYLVESGTYVYQFKVDTNGKQELVSGTLAVAK